MKLLRHDSRFVWWSESNESFTDTMVPTLAEAGRLKMVLLAPQNVVFF